MSLFSGRIGGLWPLVGPRTVALSRLLLLGLGLLSEEAYAQRAKSAGRAQAAAVRGLDAQIEKLRREWEVPGLAIAVVSADKVLYAKGFGQRDVGQHLPVTPNTLFAIASCSKSLGAATVCLLANDGLLNLDAPIHEYWPQFRLLDDYATLHLTARDLLSHRSGLLRHDLVWYHNPTVPRPELVRRLRYLPPADEPRTAFHYQNLGYTALSQLVQEVSPGHPTWEEVCRRRLLIPLGMTRTNFSVHDSERDADYARPYRLPASLKANVLEQLPLDDVDAAGAAVNVNSTALEMGRWLRATLTDGTLDGHNLLPAEALHQTHEPQMPYDVRAPDEDVYTDTYGMGWVIGSYRGFRLLTHSGSLDGFTSEMAALPGEGLAVVVLANLDDSELPHLLTNTLLDRFTGLPRVDWSARYQQYNDEDAQILAEQDSIPDPFHVPGTQPAHPLAAYAGHYRHPAYGDLLLRLDGPTADVATGAATDQPGTPTPHLHGALHGLTFGLTHDQYESFRTNTTLLTEVGPESRPAPNRAGPGNPTAKPGPSAAPAAGPAAVPAAGLAASPAAPGPVPNDAAPVAALRFVFGTDARGEVSTVSARLEPEAEPIVFERIVEAWPLTRAELVRFIGTYGPSAEASYRIYLPPNADTLRVAWPGQPEYALLPVRPTEFILPKLPGYILRFTLPPNVPTAPATEILTIQPDGLYRDRRRAVK